MWNINVVKVSLFVLPPARYFMSALTITEGTVKFVIINLDG
jgi:hypothetical protein